MVMATAVDVANVGDIPANNLQDFLGAVVGTIDYHVRVIAGLAGYTGYPTSIG